MGSAIVVLAAVVAVAPQHLGGQEQYDHSAIIDRTLREAGGVANLQRASRGQRGTIAANLLERGQLLLDLYELERILVRDHATYRDTIPLRDGPPSLVARYFLGRSYQEMSNTRQAEVAYSSVRLNAPAEIRSLAAAWTQAMSPAGSRSWQRDLYDWRSGKTVATPRCPADTPVCTLFRAVLGGDAAAILAHQARLLESSEPDFTETLGPRDNPLELQFYDPVTRYVLAMADFRLAGLVLAGVEGAESARGLALLRVGRIVEAERTLRTAVAAATRVTPASVYLGEALARSAKTSEAEETWKLAIPGFGNMVIDARISTGAAGDVAIRQYREEKTRGLSRLRAGAEMDAALARALLRTGNANEALDVLRYVRPERLATDFGVLRPDVILLVARARYAAGQQAGEREQFAHARSELGALATRYPFAIPALRLMQQVTAPPTISKLRS